MFLTDFSQLLGNDHIKTYLNRMVHNQAIANSLLFAGPDGIGKSLFAYALASMLIGDDSNQKHKLETGNHPDIHVYRPEGKLSLHSIQSMRQLSEEVYMPPFEAKWKIFIIHEADRMWSYSANALLKTFEEPPPRTLIILLSDQPAALLSTILSRCRTVHFQRVSDSLTQSFLKQRYKLELKELASITLQARGSLGRAVQLAEQGDNPIRIMLLDLLSHGPFSTYREFTDSIRAIGELIDANKKQAETLAKKSLYQGPAENLSAFQQHALEKELEGVVSLSFFSEAHAIFDTIMSWYRDLHLLQLNGDPLRLMNPDYEEKLFLRADKAKILPLEQLQVFCDDALLSLKRSTSFTLCLENLFLKLNAV